MMRMRGGGRRGGPRSAGCAHHEGGASDNRDGGGDGRAEQSLNHDSGPYGTQQRNDIAS